MLRLEVDHRKAGEDAGIPRRIQALGDTRDVLLRHGTADDLALELVTFARLQRLELDLDARELAGAAGLLLMRVVRSEEHTSELQSLIRNSSAVFCLKK